MDIVVFVAVLIMLIASIGFIVAGPFMIGQDRGIFKPSSYLWGLFECILYIIMAGRISWWW